MNQNIFAPLQMSNSFIYEKNKNLSNRALAYTYDSNKQFQFSDQSITSATKGDGCVYTFLVLLIFANQCLMNAYIGKL